MKNKKTGLEPKKTAGELLDMYYLEARSHLLETAAILDRIERASNADKTMEDQTMEDHRIKSLFKICDLLAKAKANRAEQFLKLLSVS